MGALSWEATLPFSVMAPFFIGVNHERKEFTSIGARFLLEETLFGRSSLSKEENKVTDLFPFVHMA